MNIHKYHALFRQSESWYTLYRILYFWKSKQSISILYNKLLIFFIINHKHHVTHYKVNVLFYHNIALAGLCIYGFTDVLIFLFFNKCHLFKEASKSCSSNPFPSVRTLISWSLCKGDSLLLCFVTIRFCWLKTLSHPAVWSGSVKAIWANLINWSSSSLWCSVSSDHKLDILSVGYLPEWTMFFAVVHWALTLSLETRAGDLFPLCS